MHNDIIIVGGGPAGAACATILARHGIKVLICEKATFPREKICGECINPRSWELLKTLGVEKAVLERNPTIIERLEIYSDNGKEWNVQLGTREAPFIAMSRREFDSILLQNAIAYGARLIDEAKVVGLSHRGYWKIDVDGEVRQTLSADYVVGADGRNSIVARSVCNGIRHRWQTGWRGADRVGIQWHTTFQKTLGNTLAMFLFPGGYFGAVNVSSTTANIAMVATGDLAHLAQTDFELFFQRTVFANRSAQRILDFSQPATKPSTTFPITPTFHQSNHPSAFLIGDAHQTVEPFTGEGILFALEDGITTGQMLSDRVLGMVTEQPTSVARPLWVESLLSFSVRNPGFGRVLLSDFPLIPPIRNRFVRSILRIK